MAVVIYIPFSRFKAILYKSYCDLYLLVEFTTIFDKFSILEQMIWPSIHTSHTKVYINEFVANVLRDNIYIVIFDLDEGVDFLKKVFNKSCSTTSKTP